MPVNPLTRDTFRRVVGLDDRKAIIGDSTGVIYEPGRPGFARVRYPSSNGFGYPTVVRIGVPVDLSNGLAVKVGWKDGELQIKSVDYGAMQAGGWNPLQAAAVSQQVNAIDLNLSPILISTPFIGKSLYVTLFPFRYIRNGTVHDFTGVSGGIDLSSYVPGSSGQNRVVGIYLKPDDTSEVKASTSTNDPLGTTDFQESLNASSDGSIPAVFWRMYYGQTALADTDKLWDCRQWINVPENDFATLQTTDNTQTTIASVSVAELSLVTITGTFSGAKSDYSAAIAGTFVASVRRITGGNATLVGVTVTSNEDSAGTPAFTVDADTASQTARLRCTGIAAETWNWAVKYSCLVT